MGNIQASAPSFELELAISFDVATGVLSRYLQSKSEFPGACATHVVYPCHIILSQVLLLAPLDTERSEIYDNHLQLDPMTSDHQRSDITRMIKERPFRVKIPQQTISI